MKPHTFFLEPKTHPVILSQEVVLNERNGRDVNKYVRRPRGLAHGTIYVSSEYSGG